MPKVFPRTLLEFEHWFRTEEACRDFLIKLRWPDGFRCPRCGNQTAWPRSIRQLRCSRCRLDTSVTAGTIFHDSHLPLRSWFRAAWWLTNQKNGVNALGLQRLLGLGSYKTAWSCLHRLRRAMIRPGRERLSGEVEVDEIFVGGIRKRKFFKSNKHEKMMVVVAVETHRDGIGRVRLRQIHSLHKDELGAFVKDSVEPGSRLITDGWTSYISLAKAGYQHKPTILNGRPLEDACTTLPGVHRIASLLKRWILGTYQGRIMRSRLDRYLEEFAFRFNRRHSPARGMLFYRLMQQCVAIPPGRY